jgi:hypothetical protein
MVMKTDKMQCPTVATMKTKQSTTVLFKMETNFHYGQLNKTGRVGWHLLASGIGNIRSFIIVRLLRVETLMMMTLTVEDRLGAKAKDRVWPVSKKVINSGSCIDLK